MTRTTRILEQEKTEETEMNHEARPWPGVLMPVTGGAGFLRELTRIDANESDDGVAQV